MEIIKLGDKGPAVEDVQSRLARIDLLAPESVDGVYGPNTAEAIRKFSESVGTAVSDQVDEKLWAALVDASFSLGDRTLYLRMPYFHGHDVKELQNALAALGFPSGSDDGIFGAYTELALRKFQLNMGLFSDGIAGAYTYAAIRNLHHSWEGKPGLRQGLNLGFARAAGVLEQRAICLFGTDDFTRSVAARMSNLALATNPASKMVSADSLMEPPTPDMLLVHIVLPEQGGDKNVPHVLYDADEHTLAMRLNGAVAAAQKRMRPARVSVELPGTMWEDAGIGRSAQHFAITLLDGLCTALS